MNHVCVTCRRLKHAVGFGCRTNPWRSFTREICRQVGFWLLLAGVVVAGCGRRQETRASATTLDIGTRPIRIVTTTGMIGDAVTHVGGKRVQVTSLMGPGVDPHLYKASEGDVARLASADIIFYNGLHLEGKMVDIFKQMKHRKPTFAVAEGVDPDRLIHSEKFASSHDPHIWFDVTLWQQAVAYIRDVLIRLDPEGASTYRQNCAAYLQQLEALDRYVRSRIGEIPTERRVLITAHDAFEYFGRAYGLEVHGLQGISTASETGTADIQRLAGFIVKRKIPAIFVETSVPRRYIEALQQAVRSRGFRVDIGGSLFSDAMGNPGTPEGTYLGMVQHNVDVIVNALKREPITARKHAFQQGGNPA